MLKVSPRKPAAKHPARKRVARRKKTLPYSAIRKHNKKRPTSSLELAVYAMLAEEGIPFKKEYKISRCHCDIFIAPNIVCELAGCYWHGCPECTKKPTLAQRKARISDAKRFNFFRSKGYEVVTVWEHEVKDAPERVRSLLKQIYKSTKG
jgi:G:T-mismatch repair DNA endonuclease (very short patch repair protein)